MFTIRRRDISDALYMADLMHWYFVTNVCLNLFNQLANLKSYYY